MNVRTSPAVKVGIATTTGLAPTLGIFLVIVATIFVGVGFLTAAFGDVTASIWQTAGSGAFKYFPLAMAIMLTPVFLPIYVAQGVTRRQFLVGSLMFVGVWSLLLTLAMTAGYAVEAALYSAAGWPHEFDVPHLFGTWTQFHLVGAEYFVLIAAHMVVGWLIGTTYYVLRWFRATLLIPVSLVPLAAVEALIASGWIGAGLEGVTAFSPVPVGLGLLASLAAMGVAWAAIYLLVRNVPITLGTA